MGPIKTTLDIPDPLFRRAKATAAERGQRLREFVAEALQEKLAQPRRADAPPPWMDGFGKLRALRRETARIQHVIEREFDTVEDEDRR